MSKFSKSKTEKNRGGRPRVDATPVMVRIAPDQLKRLDDWVAEEGHELSRPEAIRQLVDLGLQANGKPSLDERIAKTEQKLARKIPADASPERGVALMRKGLAEVEHRKLTARKAAKPEPASKGKPTASSGKKGNDAKDGNLTRRALIAKPGKRPRP